MKLQKRVDNRSETANQKRKNNKGPGGPLVRYHWISVQRLRYGATAKPDLATKKKSLLRGLSPAEAGSGGRI